VLELDLNVTNRCNLLCKHCVFNSGAPNDNELSLKEIRTIIDDAKEQGLEDLHITGGEPLLRKDLTDIITYAGSRGLKLRLISNGTLLTNTKLAELKQAGLRELMISLDGLEEQHDIIRGCRGSFQKTVSAVTQAVQMGFNVRVNAVAFAFNLEDLLELASFLNELNVSTFSVFLFSPTGRGSALESWLVEREDWLVFCDRLASLTRGMNMKVIVEKGYHLLSELPIQREAITGPGAGCSQLGRKDDYLIITSEGNVWPCILMVNSGYPLGNVRHNPLKEVLVHKKHMDFYHSLLDGLKACESCNSFDQCQGGCRGYAFLMESDWKQKDPRCSDKREYFPICPIMKRNLKTNHIGGSSEQAIGIRTTEEVNYDL
jgi:radical SAM protein with 4Fe4S-binding SPASM domain